VPHGSTFAEDTQQNRERTLTVISREAAALLRVDSPSFVTSTEITSSGLVESLSSIPTQAHERRARTASSIDG
jgi:hypothetical protein